MNMIQRFEGFGLGMRREHYAEFMAGEVAVDFVEVISENFMVDGGNPLHVLDQARSHYPVALHGVSLSIGSAHGLDPAYLARLDALARRIEPLWLSDHLCWTRTHAHNSHDLLPMPYTRESLELVCGHIEQAQDFLGRAMLFENPSSYLAFPEDELRECDFLAEMARRTGCYLLLDVNNVAVSAHNHGFDAHQYLDAIPADRVRQIHLAGHTEGAIRIDTHDQPVPGEVWELYRAALARFGMVATMIERDDNIPPLDELLDELATARGIAKDSLKSAAA